MADVCNPGGQRLRQKEHWKDCWSQPRLRREVHVHLGYRMGIPGMENSLLVWGEKKQKGHWTESAGERKELHRCGCKASAKGLSDWLASQAEGRVLSGITLPASDGDRTWKVAPLSPWRILRDTRGAGEERRERWGRKGREGKERGEEKRGREGRRFEYFKDAVAARSVSQWLSFNEIWVLAFRILLERIFFGLCVPLFNFFLFSKNLLTVQRQTKSCY